MMAQEITLIYPPIHDFAMPYLSLPLLKKYIEDNTGVKCRIVDFNLQFFSHIIGSIEKNVTSLDMDTKDFSLTVMEAIELQRDAKRKMDVYLDDYPNYDLSLRKIKTPFDTTKSDSIYSGLRSKQNLFYTVFSQFIGDSKFKTTYLFGISIGVEDQIFPSFTLAKVIKKLFPHSKIVLGGNIITRLYENISESKLSKYVDYLVIKEGEDALVELVKYHILKEIKELSHPKIISIKNNKISVRSEKIMKHLVDIKKINTPDFSEFNLKSYFSPIPILPIFITRKCYWGKCDFCSIHTSWDPIFRAREISQVMNDVEFYKKQGINHFRIVDEDCPPNILKSFSEEILDRNLSIFFEAYSRFEKNFLDLDFCRELSKAGCRQLFFGLESIGEKTLRLTNKVANYKNYREFIDKILENTNKSGILNYVFVIIGIPNAPIEEEIETIDYLIKNKNVHVVTPASFVVDKYSPLHVDAAIKSKYCIKLFDVGDMTTEIGYSMGGKDLRSRVQKRTKQYAKEIYNNRPDLALTTLLIDEIRFALTCKFGNNFAQEFIPMCEKSQIKTIIDEAIRNCYEERVKRQLEKSLEVNV